MGEKDQGGKNEGEKKPADKKDDGKVAAVFKMDLHCEGCARKVKRVVRNIDGVEQVKADCSANKLTVAGKADPSAIKEMLEQKTKKKVELVSAPPKKDGGGDKKPEEKAQKKEEVKKSDDKKPKESTAVLKIRLHCDGCIQKIRKIVSKFGGVQNVDIDKAKDLLSVKGTMDVKELVPYLKAKLKRSVDVVPPKKDEAGDQKPKEAGGGGDKKEKEKEASGGGGEKKEKEAAAAGGGGEKKEKEAAAAGGGGEKKEKEAVAAGGGGGDGGKKEEGAGAKVEVSKMDYHGYPYQAPMYWHDGPAYAQNYPMVVHPGYGNQGFVTHGYVDDQGYGPYGNVNHGYMVAANHPMHAPQLFSDENPNACSVM
ncbi:hypothetical protein F2P56_008634 [Juglans regia]|uniref:Heavy metal-associated isoprenylated plant protein 6-like n=2 Tax=Juglans regia TaxID=51240 RepID=A0A2I4DNK5_JUGRE|nr:heavy metal-associated isoprenylated plant protein 6-like [Juglans regia]KAF5471870.1 hypothetical protein F2P56_008634 [Juglans regia]